MVISLPWARKIENARRTKAERAMLLASEAFSLKIIDNGAAFDMPIQKITHFIRSLEIIVLYHRKPSTQHLFSIYARVQPKLDLCPRQAGIAIQTQTFRCARMRRWRLPKPETFRGSLILLAHFTGLNGKLLATYGDLATFYTHLSKNLVTGERGCVLTNDATVTAKARRFSYPDALHGTEPSLNYSMAGLQAALGLARLLRLDEDIAGRHKHMSLICGGLDNPHIELLPVVADGETGQNAC